MGERKELTEDEMIEEIDKVLIAGESDRFTPEQAAELRKRMNNLRLLDFLEDGEKSGREEGCLSTEEVEAVLEIYLQTSDNEIDESKPISFIRVKGILPMENYTLWIKFNTGEQKVFDFKPYLEEPAFEPLKILSVFKKVYVDNGVPTWLDGKIEIPPDRLYEFGIKKH